MGCRQVVKGNFKPVLAIIFQVTRLRQAGKRSWPQRHEDAKKKRLSVFPAKNKGSPKKKSLIILVP